MKTYGGKLCSLITAERLNSLEAKHLLTPLLVGKILISF